MTERVPHTDVALEQAYIRSCVLGYRQSHLASGDERLAPTDCHVDAHRIVLEALYEAADAKTTVDTFTGREAVLAHARGAAAVAKFDSIVSGGEVSKSVERMAVKLRQLARARRRYNVLRLALAASLEGRDDAVSEYALQLTSDSTETRADEFLPAHEAAFQAADYFRKLEVERSQKTGFGILDHAVLALQPQSLTVIGGTTGSGKSSLMLAMALHQARAGIPVCIVSLEDPMTTWGPRIAAHFSGINPNEICPGMDDNVWTRTVGACEQMKRLPAHVHMAFEIGRPLGDVLRAIRYNCRKNKCKIVYVDYLQAIGWEPGKDENRRLFVSHATSSMKALCAELGVALVLGSQLTRAEKGAEYKEPQVSALKESGDIENMAEIVVLLWKTGDKDESVTMGKVAKVKWTPRRPRFELLRGVDSGSIIDVTTPTAAAASPVVVGGFRTGGGR